MRGIKAVRLAVLASLSLACCASALVAPAADAAEGPTSSSSPSVSGVARDGQRLKLSKGAWSGAKPISYSYQWSRCDAGGGSCTAIEFTNSASYKVAHADVGHTLRASVSASNSEGQTSETSAPSDLVASSALVKRKHPTISGSPKDGQLLTVGNGTWKGTPPDSYEYQWQTCAKGGVCSDIPGATSASYRATTSAIKSKLRAVVTATNAIGHASAASKLSKPIAAGPPVSIGAPTIAGSVQEGQTLSAAPGAWAGTAPIAFAYRWLRCSVAGGSCEEIEGATASTYTLGVSDLASNLAVVVTATNAQGAADATSAETQAVLGILPTDTVLPSISGLLQDGGLLSVASGSWSGTEPIAYAYQWQLCNALGQACESISGATGSTLKLDPSEIGKTLAVVVTATNAAGSASATSSVTELIAGILPKNTALPSIGGVLQDGSLLSATNGSWTGSEPLSYAYQWQLCNAAGKVCEEIAGATGSTLKLDPSEIGKTLALVVTATNAAGSTSATSTVTGLIEGILPKNTALPTISGLLKKGASLSTTNGSWSGSEPISYTYQWQLCTALKTECLDVAKATSPTFLLGLLQVANTVRVIVTATNAAGSTSQPSAVSGLIAAL
jgi:hypothetical protein